MPWWSRHSTPEALKDRPQLQTDCRTHTYTHKGHNQSRNNRETCTHTHTHGPSERRPRLTPPNRQRGGGGRCLQAGEWQHKDRRLPGCRQVWSIIKFPSLQSFLPFFSICISILLFPPWLFSSPFTFHSKLWLTHPRIYQIFSSTCHHSLALQLLCISFLSHVHKEIFHHREHKHLPLNGTDQRWYYWLKSHATELWKQNESKLKWVPNTERHKVQPRKLRSESWVLCCLWHLAGAQW